MREYKRFRVRFLDQTPNGKCALVLVAGVEIACGITKSGHIILFDKGRDDGFWKATKAAAIPFVDGTYNFKWLPNSGLDFIEAYLWK